ncbi:hypothetical protein Syun_009118 [Stephania yunnanensis]|uniref:Myosin motor domain-containing protein n=1 Tax=Stephania yunnanensis TaxID=152371 RepID=A0AAP0KG01_9MAGN
MKYKEELLYLTFNISKLHCTLLIYKTRWCTLYTPHCPWDRPSSKQKQIIFHNMESKERLIERERPLVVNEEGEEHEEGTRDVVRGSRTKLQPYIEAFNVVYLEKKIVELDALNIYGILEPCYHSPEAIATSSIILDARTKIGPVLLAMNPFKDVEVCGNELVAGCRKKPRVSHDIFYWAQNAFIAMMNVGGQDGSNSARALGPFIALNTAKFCSHSRQRLIVSNHRALNVGVSDVRQDAKICLADDVLPDGFIVKK